MAITQIGANLPNAYNTPSIFPKMFLAKFYATSVTNKICDLQYESQIFEYGNLINIRKIPDVNVYAASENQQTNWQDLTDGRVQLSIDYAYEAAIFIGNITFHQIDTDLKGALVNEMANRLRIATENVVLGGAYASATTIVATQDWRTAGNPTDALTNATASMGTLNIPTNNRYFVGHPQALRYLKKEVTLYALNSGNPKGALIQGYVGEYDGMSVYESSLIPGAGTVGSPYICIAGQKVGVALATQYTDFQVDLPLESRMGNGLRCQNAFGYKTVIGDALVKVNVQVA